jgi:hypothetical protein
MKTSGTGKALRASVALLALLAAAPAFAQEQPKLETNQSYLEELNRNAQAPLADKKEMLAFVLRTLPDRVKVYPTENYFYFSFFSGGVRHAGNIRLDASDRDKGRLHFAYYAEHGAWLPDSPVTYAVMDLADGVKVEKLERFLYRVSLGDRSVLFELNDLSQARPPEQALDPDERFIGPVFDESGTRFFLVYNEKLRLFHYILDETVPLADRLQRSKATDRIEIAARTGFAFYRDLKRERRILIGVFEDNVLANNYFDGPFDQLPDNFIEGDDLLKAILQVAPNLQGTVDRFGGSFDGSERFLIAPYMAYRQEEELLRAHRCATGPQGKSTRYYACFALDQEPAPPPGKLKSPPRGKGPPKK